MFLKSRKYQKLYKELLKEKGESKPNETIAERVQLKRQKSDDHLPPMPPLEGDEEEITKGKELKIRSPNKLLTRLSILLAKTTAGNNSNKLEKRNQANNISFVSEQ